MPLVGQVLLPWLHCSVLAHGQAALQCPGDPLPPPQCTASPCHPSPCHPSPGPPALPAPPVTAALPLLPLLQNLPEVAGAVAKLRANADGTPYVTDNSNFIVDLYFEEPLKDAHAGGVGRSLGEWGWWGVGWGGGVAGGGGRRGRRGAHRGCAVGREGRGWRGGDRGMEIGQQMSEVHVGWVGC